MFFKRASKDKQPEAAPEAASALKTVAAEAAAVPAADSARLEPKPLAASELRHTADPAQLGFRTTADLEPSPGLIGQDRALAAIAFGAGMKAGDFNIFVLGPPASGKSTAVKEFLATKAAAAPAPDDWVYVNNFDDASRPKAIRMPAGRAGALARIMSRAVDELRQTLPRAFESEDYQARRRAIDEEFRESHEGAIEALGRKAAQQNVALMRTPMGFAMAPMHDGKVVKPEVFEQLPEHMKAEVRARIEGFEKELEAILQAAPKADKVRRQRTEALNEEVARFAIEDALEPVKAAFQDITAVLEHVEAAEADLVGNVGLFLADGEEGGIVKEPIGTLRDPRFRRYMVNVVVGQQPGPTGAPVYEEDNPAFGNLCGRAEHLAHMGALVTDFMLIKPGALHRANGGYLLIDARKLLLSPFAYEALKRALKGGQIKIESPLDTAGLVPAQTLEPEPIPLAIKVILTGERLLYYQLVELDPDFSRLFKVQADFDDSIERSKENDRAYARLIASVVANHKLKPVDAAGVARLIDEGARLAGDREKLSIEVGRIADIVREADYWAGASGRSLIGRDDVVRAINEHIQRADRLRDRTQETFERGIMLVDTEGEKCGQINGLSVASLGDFAFGRPSRITARVHMGQGRVTDIEREVKLGGPLHSKGVMILWGYLAGQFAHELPLALAATLVFEQSYGGVDGDSASLAELCALLSALAGVTIRQGLAVTGSVNQWGEVQAIGGVNEKIEGFFDVCSARGLTGEQGVLIPASNAQHLMLHEDVVEAVREDTFKVYGVKSVDEAIEILTGKPAGKRDPDGRFPEGSVNRLVEDKLKAFAERAMKLNQGGGGKNGAAVS